MNEVQESNNCEVVDTKEVLERVVGYLQMIPESIRRCDFRVCNPDEELFRAQAVALEAKAYDQAGYAERAENESLFENQYRGSVKHGEIAYLGVYTLDGKLAAFFSIFQNFEVIFDACKQKIGEIPALKDIPMFVFSKIARDPSLSDFIYKTGAPHRTLLAMTVVGIAKHCSKGLMVETQAQPDTQRLLRHSNISRFFPNYQRLVDLPITEEKDVPHILLLYFPHIRMFDFISIGRAILSQTIKPLKHK